MDKFLESRWFLRGFALLMATIMFATVNNPEDQATNTTPNAQTDSHTIENVPVDTIFDQESLVVTGVPSTVDVTIEGPSQVVTRTNAIRDFRVFIDLSEEEIGTQEAAIEHEGFSTQLKVTLSEPVANVTIDERVSEEFTVETDYNEAIIPEGYTLDELSVSPKTVLVTGAKGIIDSIQFVRATINVDGTVEDEETVQSPVQVLNAELDKLPVTVEPSNVDVSISVIQPSKEVPLVPTPTGTLPDGAEVQGLSLERDTVIIFGQADKIAEIDEIEVPIDLSEVEESGSAIEVQIPKPDGVNELSDTTVPAVVTFEENAEAVDGAAPDEPDQSQDSAEDPEAGDEAAEEESNTENEEELTLSALPVEIRGAGDDLDASFQSPSDGELNLRITGSAEDLEGLTEDDVSLYVDASDLEEGEHQVAVEIEGPENVTYSLSQANVTIQLSQA
ncbi:hypothetical protein E2R51_15750 [Jeotgalibacillus sp. S-D1]|uniref:CdaR family protein n=1 Tax=Jeotgalibacillus sp. S-D1 TaxID=2552189 RepID=UPI001059FDC5|nr:CdaR family protein [Jeotgalibacillus sp. S-D1]TDL30784.1 hypothetical protein E2R51_15750 [Jeotgalibacillus sp. S-D1]